MIDDGDGGDGSRESERWSAADGSRRRDVISLGTTLPKPLRQ